MRKYILVLLILLNTAYGLIAQPGVSQHDPFIVKGFHLDLRVQVMTMDALKAFALKLQGYGVNTLIMEWEGTYPFEKHPLIPNRYAYTKTEVTSFIKYCSDLGIDVIPLQQSFGHVEYILRNDRYKALREDQKDFSQVCPLQTRQDSALFTDLYTELASTHTSKYIHIGGDETYLLGHDERCRLMVAKEGKSKLYINYIRMLCNIVIRLGKTPVLWADIALKYPKAIKLLPKGTVFIDWNYGWDLNNFGDHKKLVQSGYEIWGAPALRSSPDNYFLTQWEKHFKNIRDFVPQAAKLGYKGIVMTSWSTSGQYSQVFESENELTEEYAIRHVYPLSGFNMLVAAYAQSIKSAQLLDIDGFITGYCKEHYGFNASESAKFWKTLKTAPYELFNGEVKSTLPLTVKQLRDSAKEALETLYDLQPAKNKDEFEHYRLMAGIRANYLEFHYILQTINSPEFMPLQKPAILDELKNLMINETLLDLHFSQLNKNFLYPAELAEENELRSARLRLLYDRLAGNK
ncbi:beta-N-acetylhexosaminidase [Mucilaginibacter sp.]|uniref:beta-N-acetylhexosaminidase n=1 Tax=Mucilaginibacter sp. TaxID=1882438 RepID=UPI0028451B77|nr:beta-N-acetylhexosaminidase [Mucilaginibacter sp.]MDR3695995.1 beta-N-acetylhexosaminidase [Mucilaginibacter sp.]